MISQQTIDQVRDTLVKEFNPVEIYLYGPSIWGTPEDEGELDILVVVDTVVEDRYNMLVRGHHVLNNLDVAKDLRIYSKDEFERSANDITRPSYKIKRKGKCVYARA